MAYQYEYGVIDKSIPFKLTKNGVAVTGITFSTSGVGDVTLSIDGGATTNIASECLETTGGLGWYEWTPTSATQTQGSYAIINIAEVSGTNFDENSVTLQFGGHASAWLNG